jgi:hypothetical protein
VPVASPVTRPGGGRSGGEGMSVVDLGGR